MKIVPVDLNKRVFVCYGDSGWAHAAGNNSQGSFVITATSSEALESPQPASLLEWRSYRHQRVLRSTLAAEACSLDKAQDYGHFLAMMFSEITNKGFVATLTELPEYQVIPVTDARSLWDSAHRLSTHFQEKRVEFDIAGLRESCRNLRWVPTEQQWADTLTKPSPSARQVPRLDDGAHSDTPGLKKSTGRAWRG